MSVGALHSDHINYLILRYLQEHGHESAATAFYSDWHRPSEFYDPETLPFAPTVKRHALVSVVRDGLLYDELSAKHSKYGRKFPWTAVNPRQPLDEQDVSVLENGTAGGSSRPPSSGKRKGRPPVMRAPDEFPTPAPKRQRRSEGSEGVHLNGDRDTMDVDPARSPTAEADEDAEAVSPNIASDTEIIEIPERYDSMDVATQTEVKTGPKTSTMYWKVDKPGARIVHSMWNPDSDPKNAKTLLTVGESLCRFYDVPDEMDDAKQITHADDPNVPSNSEVTATAWHPDGHSAACAVDRTCELTDGQKEPLHLILIHDRDHGSLVLDSGFELLEHAGIVLCLRYSPKGEYLLVARANLERGLVQIWRTSGLHAEDGQPVQTEPIAWRIFEHQVLDACWTAEDSFLVCGDEGLSSAYRVDPTDKVENGFSAGSVAVQGLRETRSHMVGLKAKWDKVRFDENLGVAVFASMESRHLITLPLRGDVSAEASGEPSDVDGALDLAGQLTALAFQPITSANAGDKNEERVDGSLLAATFEQGICVIYRVTRPTETCTKCEELLALELPEGPALALSWSSGGAQLAIGGTDLVQIWQASDLMERQNGKRHVALVTWRPDHAALGRRNGVHVEENEAEEEVMVGPSLSWSADGESVGFAVDKQLAVIRFRPPLRRPLEEMQVCASPIPEATAAPNPDVVEGAGGPRTKVVGNGSISKHQDVDMAVLDSRRWFSEDDRLRLGLQGDSSSADADADGDTSP